MNSSAFISNIKGSVGTSAWKSALSLSRDMLRAAQADEWDRVLRLEAERRQQIGQYFASGVAPEDAQFVREDIVQILDSDRELMRLIERKEPLRPSNVIPFRPIASKTRRYAATVVG